jgi:hypothetical protein
MCRNRAVTRGRHMLILSLTALSAFLVDAVPAAAVLEWAPVNANVDAISTALRLEVAKTGILSVGNTCQGAIMIGTLGAPNNREWNITTGFEGCGFASEGIWKASDESATTAGLKIPAGGSLKVEIEPGCKVKVAPQTITSTYSNRANGRRVPSFWRFNNTVTLGVQAPMECFNMPESATGKLTGVFMMENRTNMNVPITVS